MFCRDLIRSFQKSNNGSTAIEFAFVALPTIALLFGAVQIGLIYFATQNLDYAVFQVSRFIKTGQAINANANSATLKQRICKQLVFVPNCDYRLELSVRAFPSPSATRNANLFQDNHPVVNGAFDLGHPNDIVIVSAALRFFVLYTPIKTDFERSANNPRRQSRPFGLLYATSIVQNEQYAVK